MRAKGLIWIYKNLWGLGIEPWQVTLKLLLRVWTRVDCVLCKLQAGRYWDALHGGFLFAAKSIPEDLVSPSEASWRWRHLSRFEKHLLHHYS
jgi:hypothetical protein